MSDIEKIDGFLTKAGVFYLITLDGDQPKGRPFGFHLLKDGHIYFGAATAKNCFKQMEKHPKIEILALSEGEFLRYDGTAEIVHDDEIMKEVEKALPEVMEMYRQKGWTMGIFRLKDATAEIRTAVGLKEALSL